MPAIVRGGGPWRKASFADIAAPSAEAYGRGRTRREGEIVSQLGAATGTTPSDADRLAALGYESHFERRMGLWENFSLGFTYLSPVVGVYSTFVLAFVAGGIYPWARRLIGKRYAWMIGWMYGWALLVTIAAVSTGAAPFAGYLFGFTATRGVTVIVAGVLVIFACLVNLSGTRTLGRVAFAGFFAELVGALFVGIWLLLFERHHDFGTLFDTLGTEGNGSYLGAFLAASLLGLYLFYGFEACGDVAEEVPHPGRVIPRAMRRTIYIGGFAALLVTAALILSQTDFGAILRGENADPITATFESVFGRGGAKAIMVIVLISFVSCVLSLQAAASRLLYSYARDRMIFGSHLLSHFSSRRHVPPYALIVAAIVPIAIVGIAEAISPTALLRVISFASCGIYIAFQGVVG